MSLYAHTASKTLTDVLARNLINEINTFLTSDANLAAAGELWTVDHSYSPTYEDYDTGFFDVLAVVAPGYTLRDQNRFALRYYQDYKKHQYGIYADIYTGNYDSSKSPTDQTGALDARPAAIPLPRKIKKVFMAANANCFTVVAYFSNTTFVLSCGGRISYYTDTDDPHTGTIIGTAVKDGLGFGSLSDVPKLTYPFDSDGSEIVNLGLRYNALNSNGQVVKFGANHVFLSAGNKRYGEFGPNPIFPYVTDNGTEVHSLLPINIPNMGQYPVLYFTSDVLNIDDVIDGVTISYKVVKVPNSFVSLAIAIDK